MRELQPLQQEPDSSRVGLLTTGEGRIMVINDADSPPDLHLLDSFNFSASALAPIASLHWAATSTTWTPPDLPLELADLDRSDAAAGVAQQLPPGTKAPKRNSRDVQKLRKRKAAFDKAKEARDEYFAGGFDGCVSGETQCARVSLSHEIPG